MRVRSRRNILLKGQKTVMEVVCFHSTDVGQVTRDVVALVGRVYTNLSDIPLLLFLSCCRKLGSTGHGKKVHSFLNEIQYKEDICRLPPLRKNTDSNYMLNSRQWVYKSLVLFSFSNIVPFFLSRTYV
jgi:hypothetical protein